MDNFILGLQAIWNGLIVNMQGIGQYKTMWGFALGFIVSTIVYAFIITDNPKHVPKMLLEDRAVSFQAINKMKDGKYYETSFVEFSKKVDKLKLLITIGFSVVAVLLITTMITALLK